MSLCDRKCYAEAILAAFPEAGCLFSDRLHAQARANWWGSMSLVDFVDALEELKRDDRIDYFFGAALGVQAYADRSEL